MRSFGPACAEHLSAVTAAAQAGADRHISFRITIFEVLFFLLLVYLPFQLSILEPVKGRSSIWLAQEWHKLPQNWLLMVEISFLACLLMLLTFLLLLWLLNANKRKNLVSLFILLLLPFVILQILTMSAGEKALMYFVAFALPLILSYYGSRKGFLRLFSRSLSWSMLGLIIFWHYVGFLPKPYPGKDATGDLIEILYPAEGKSSGFPLAYMRDMKVDHKRNYLYTTFGPASGIVRLNLNNLEPVIIPTDGLTRYLWTDDDTDLIYTIDWDTGDLLLLSKEPFEMIKRVDILDGELISPWSITCNPENIYIVSNSYPTITEFSRDTLMKTRRISFRDTGLTRFLSGAYMSLYDAEYNKIFVEIGMVDLSRGYSLVRIDAGDFKVDGVATIPEGGLGMLLIPDKGSILTTAFFSDNFYEFDMDTLRLRRAFKGALNCRVLTYDKGRGLIYAASFLKGELLTIRYGDGEIISRMNIGKKCCAMTLSNIEDSLYIGSRWGIMKIDLKKLLISH